MLLCSIQGQSLSLPTGQWGTPPLSLVNSPDISVANGSPGVTGIKSPHLTSPVIQVRRGGGGGERGHDIGGNGGAGLMNHPGGGVFGMYV